MPAQRTAESVAKGQSLVKVQSIVECIQSGVTMLSDAMNETRYQSSSRPRRLAGMAKPSALYSLILLRTVRRAMSSCSAQ